jgi:hypothetical protein
VIPIGSRHGASVPIQTGVKPLPKAVLGAALAASAVVVLSSDVHLERDLAARLRERSVRVVVVDDSTWLRETRDALRDQHIVGERPGAFALEGGRVYARSHAAATKLLNAQGWGDRTIVLGADPSPHGDTPMQQLSANVTPARVRWALRGLALVGVAVVLAGGQGLWQQRRERGRRRRALEPVPSPVLVLRVAGRADLAEVRASVAAERIVAEHEDAFAVGDGWIVSCTEDGASRLLRRAGWRHRTLEAHRPDPFGSAARRDDWSIDTGPEPPDDKHVWSAREAILAVARASELAPGGCLNGFARAPVDLDEPPVS